MDRINERDAHALNEATSMNGVLRERDRGIIHTYGDRRQRGVRIRTTVNEKKKKRPNDAT